MALTIAQAVWLVGVHSIIHGIIGIFVIMTSFYVNYNPAIIHSFLAANVVFIILGFCIFCVVVWRNPHVSRAFGIVLALIAIFYLVTAIIYFIEYMPFFANSVFDAYLYYKNEECWAGPDKKIVSWHVLAMLLILPVFLWFYYAFLLFKLACEVFCLPCPVPQPPRRKRVETYIDEVICKGGQVRRKERWLSKIRPGTGNATGTCGSLPPCPPTLSPSCQPPCQRPIKKPAFSLTLRTTKLPCQQ